MGLVGSRIFLKIQRVFRITNHTSQQDVSYLNHSSQQDVTQSHTKELVFLKKNFHPSIQHNGGRKMGVKNPKIFTPKVVLDPNSIFKNHYFVTYKPHLSLTEVTWTYLGSEGFGSEGFFERYHFLYQVDFEISKKNLHP